MFAPVTVKAASQAAAASQEPERGAANALEIEFKEDDNEHLHRSDFDIDSNSFYFNPIGKHKEVQPGEVTITHDAYDMGERVGERYFVTSVNAQSPPADKPLKIFNVTNKQGTPAVIRIMDGKVLAPQSGLSAKTAMAQLRMVKDQGGLSTYNDPTVYVNLYENTATRIDISQLHEGLLTNNAERDFKAWCQDPSGSKYELQELGISPDVKKLLCTM